MARPFPDTFEQDASPLSPLSAGAQGPISYSANVNRKKTQKWVEAKPADYGGDDWGDEYAEEYPPPNPPKTTGLRQPGQVAQFQAATSQGNREGASSRGNKQAYGELPPLPAEPPARTTIGPATDRMSFVPGDERRAFSGIHAPVAGQAVSAANPAASYVNAAPGAPVKQLSNLPPALQVSTQVPAVSGIRKSARQDSPADTPPRQVEPQSGASSQYSEMTKNSEARTPVSDFYARRDFSPSAVPLPLQGRYSPVPRSAGSDSSATKFPPRKSSISQPTPNVSDSSQAGQESSTYKPWTGGRPASPGGAVRSPTATGKSIPFVRPADIYKRVEQERERERQSLDSSRPSMDSIGGGKSSERSASPTNTRVPEQEVSDNVSIASKTGVIQDNEDISDHGRRLAPVLEPVKERKSEYGFDGFDPMLATEVAEEEPQFDAPPEPSESQSSAENLRRFSTSPKLPDLNRISGFGIDLFSPSKFGEIGTSEPAMPAVPEKFTAMNVAELKDQPSYGITSTVREAIDAGGSSVPKTPASIGSSIERTGSESTGTTGISPIMSRAPKGVVSSTKSVISNVGENTTSSVAEANEAIPAQDLAKDAPQVFDSQARLSTHKDDYVSGRRDPRTSQTLDMTTPTRGGSPARTPKVESTGKYGATEEAYLSETSDPGVSPLEDDHPTASRPSAEREQSFRPALPGGWVSYATTNSDQASEKELTETQQPEQTELPNLQIESANTPVSPISEEGDDDYDLTPTTTKRALPQSALSAAAGAAFGGVTTAALDQRDQSSPSSPTTVTAAENSRAVLGNRALPTPDPALAPMGNPYASSTLDPRLQGDTNSMLQPPQSFTSQQYSSASSAPPTPPPKDTPAEVRTGNNPDYFPPIVPLKHKTVDEVATSEGLEPPTRPPMLPTLSTQTSPQDETNDKLRKEIMKSLSPTVSDAKPEKRLSPPDISQHVPYEGFTNSGARESTYLPSEYDNYWESAEETEPLPEKTKENSGQAGFESDSGQRFSEQPIPQDNTAPQDIPASAVDMVSTPSSDGVRRLAGGETLQRPPLYANRFSWEAGPEQVTPVAGAAAAAGHANESHLPTPGIDASYATTPGTSLRDLEATRETYLERGPINSSAHTMVAEAPVINAPQIGSNLRTSSAISDNSESAENESSDNHSRNSAVQAAAGVAATVGVAAGVAAAFADGQPDHDSMSKRRPSLAEQKRAGNVSEYAISPTPPEEEHPARASLPPSTTATATSEPVQTAPRGSQGLLPMATPQRMSDITKIMQFRDIVALQQPEQRIRAFNDTRYQFANMDTGLADWIMAVNSNQEETIGAGPWGGLSNTGDSTPRSKGPKTGSAGGLGTPLQQPYYQQYLNASPSSVPANSRPSTGITSGTQQGFSPSGGVQGKGKDSHHSSGIFGGKAKGLLAKGKKKFRGSGGGDKDSPPLDPSPATKDGRRTSWGLSMPSLALSRSSIRAETSSQHSRAETATNPPGSHQTPGTLPPVTAGQSERSLWDAPVSAASTPSIPNSTLLPPTNKEPSSSLSAETNGQIRMEEKEEERDTLGVPAPIGKYQPSWDPFNATPIAEEEGFQYDEQQHSKQPPDATKSTPFLGAPQRQDDSKTDHSASDRTVSHDAPEQPTDQDDWVLVSKDGNSPQTTNAPRRDEKSMDNSIQNLNGPNPSNTTSGSIALMQSAQLTQPQNPPALHNPLKQPPVGAIQAGPTQSEGFQVSPAYPQHAASQFSPASQPPIGRQQLAHDQQHTVSQIPGGPLKPATYQQQEVYQAPPGPPPGYQAPTGYQYPVQSYPPHGSQFPPGSQPHPGSQPPRGFRPPGTQFPLGSQAPYDYRTPGSQPTPEPQPPTESQPPAAPQGGLRGLFQHMRQKSSKDGSMAPPSQPPAPGPNFPSQDVNAPLPVAYMSQQDPADENKPLQRQSADFVGLPPIRRSSTFGLGFGKKDPTRRFALDDEDEDTEPIPNAQPTPKANQIQDTDDGTMAGPVFGAATIAAAVGDRINKPSVEPSRYSFERENKPAILGAIDVNAQHPGRNSVPPAGPTSASAAVLQNNQPITYNGRQNSSQQIKSPAVGIVDNRSRLDGRSSQEIRPPYNAGQPGRPSYDGQRPAPVAAQAHGPSFEGQRIRSPSSSSPAFADNPQILGSGVYVPPPRSVPTQQKSLEQPPSSAQRYPELFRPDYAKETSVDGLPAHYYQAPVSREDAFLPRTQTNEYQLPGVGPPPDEPRTGRRSRRNSALFKELGGRLSRSVSRDRGSTRDDYSHSPGTPGGARDFHGQDNSAPSIASEDMSEKKKRRKSGLAFFGAARRDSANSSALTRENTGTSSPVSRVDSFPQQHQGSPLANPNTKKSFFGNNRNTEEQRNSSQLSRVSTSGVPVEQQGKKKRFSGLTSMFSRPSAEQDMMRQSESAIKSAQDPRDHQNPSLGPQPPRYPDTGMRSMAQDPRIFQGQPQPISNGGLLSQQPVRAAQDAYHQGPTQSPDGRSGSWQRGHPAGIQQDPQGRGAAISPETRPLQTSSTGSPQNTQHAMRLGNEPQPYQRSFSNLQSPQDFQGQPLGIAQRDPAYQQQIPQPSVSPVPNRQSVPTVPLEANGGQNTPGPQGPHDSRLSVSPTPNRQIIPTGMPMEHRGQNLPGNPASQQPQPSFSPTQNRGTLPPGAPGQYGSQNMAARQDPPQQQTSTSPAQNRQDVPSGAYGSQNMAARQSPPQQPSTSPAQNRQGVPPGPLGAYGSQSPLGAWGSQQPQYQHQAMNNPQQGLPGGATPTQAPLTNTQDPRIMANNQSTSNQQKSELKPRQPSRLLSGIMGGLGSGSKAKAASQQPSGEKLQKQQQQQQPQQQPQLRSQMPVPQNAPGQSRPIKQEPQYEQPPIPGGYTLVRGEGGYLAPTSYDPRGLSNQYGPQSNPQLMYRGKPQGYLQQPPPAQANQMISEHYSSAQKPRNVPTLTVTARNDEKGDRPGPESRQSSQDPRGVSRQLSREDILARSPARPQSDQQAPYKLTLPEDTQGKNARDTLLPTGTDLPSERISNGNKAPTERTIPTVAAINTSTQSTQPAQPVLRHPQSPSTYPLPHDSPFSPVNPSASQIPAPPPPKWPQQAAPSHSLDRSDTINTHASEISRLSGQLSVPATSKESESGQPSSVTPPSPQLTPQLTPERSPERLRSAATTRKVSDDDVYNATPRNSNSPTKAGPAVHDRGAVPPPQMSPEKMLVEEGMSGPSQQVRRRVSQEEKILVDEDDMVRPDSADDLPSMSATSYPGMEWNPYGAAEYQDWD